MKRKRQSKGPYVALPIAIIGTTAWRTMSPEGRLLWIELRSRVRNDDLNNGKIFRSCRDAAKALGFDKGTISYKFAELEHYGFLRKTTPGFLGSDGRGIAARYRFTDLTYGPHPPSRDYEKWDGSIFENRPRKSGSKKQNPVRPRRTPRTSAPYIRTAPEPGSVCTSALYRGEAAKCTSAPYRTSLPLGEPTLEHEQGSSTARAPAQAGGAGSSPAPVAKPDPLRGPDGELTTMVLGIVNAQLDELEARRPPSSSPSASQDAVPPARKPWTTPTVTEISLDDLPTELRMLALGLPAPAEKQPEAPPRPAIYGQTRPRIYGAQCEKQSSR
jgi:hypothetical protein